MQIIETIHALRENLSLVRLKNQRIALVPTMGNLHEGHLALVKKAKELGEHVVVTIFVNPTQFVQGEDFESYPRTEEQDLKALEDLSVDTVFKPETSEVYQNNVISTEVRVPELDSIYCGEFRPGHFKGVATIVTKLFNIVQPDIAVFGEKDYQQLLVIKSLVKNLDLPIEIVGFPTVREIDGLAMSSRNSYLTKEERKIAPKLYECLVEIAEKVQTGDSNYQDLQENGLSKLSKAGFRTDYLNICDAETLGNPDNENIIIIAAAWLGKARLIDNVAVHTYD